MFFQRRGKYNATKTEIVGMIFDSQLEARIYLKYIKPLAAAEGWKVERQKKFELTVNGEKICEYIADFLVVKKNGESLVYECKGMMLPDALIKLRLFEAIHGIPVYVAKSLKNIYRLNGYRKRKCVNILSPTVLDHTS